MESTQRAFQRAFYVMVALWLSVIGIVGYGGYVLFDAVVTYLRANS